MADVALFPDALDANRRGELSDQQSRGFGALSAYRRRNALSIAAFLIAGGVLVGFFASPTASIAMRVLVAAVCFGIAAILVLRSITGLDALTRDLRHVEVRSVEGPLGKRRTTTGRTVGTYFLDVGNTTFTVAPATYAAVPAAGHIRVYFLPRSRKVVNFEQLPTPSAAGPITPKDMLESVKSALFAPTRVERNEARAEMAGLGETLKENVVPPSAVPPSSRDTRPLGDAIVGAWHNAMMRVTFDAGGTVTVDMLGTQRRGHWSVDRSGRLQADITGRMGSVDAWIADDQLTIALEGRSMTFTRG